MSEHVEPVVSPRLAKRRLAYGLAELRDEKGWSQTQAAKEVGCGTSRIANMEVRRNLPSEELLTDMLRAYGRESEVNDWLALRATAQQREAKWRGLDMSEFVPGFDEFVSLEGTAQQIEGYEPRLVPGILQTPDYASRIIRSCRTVANLDRKIQIRTGRQEALLREHNPAHLWLVVEEQALDRPVGASDVMRAQFEHLLELAALDNVQLQIAPTSIGPHLGMTSPFLILRFSSPRDPGLVAIETRIRTIFFEEPAEITQFSHEMDHLRTLALSQEASTELINTKRKEV